MKTKKYPDFDKHNKGKKKELTDSIPVFPNLLYWKILVIVIIAKGAKFICCQNLLRRNNFSWDRCKSE